MTMAKDNGGSALVWAVCSMLVLAIIISGILGIGLAYNGRSLGDETSRQAYLSARSAVEAVLAHAEAPVYVYAVDALGNSRDDRGQLVTLSDEQLWLQIQALAPLMPRYAAVPVAVSGFAASGGQGFLEGVAGTVARLADTSAQWRVAATARQGDYIQTVSALVGLEITGPEAAPAPCAAEYGLDDIFCGIYAASLEMPGQSTLRVVGGNLIFEALNVAQGRHILVPDGLARTGLRLARGTAEYDRALPAAGAATGLSAAACVGDCGAFGDAFPPGFVPAAGEAITPGLENPGKGSSLRLAEGDAAFDIGGIPRDTELYVFLAPGATLTLLGSHQPGARLFVYGGQGARVILADGMQLCGAVVAPVIRLEGSAQIEYSSPRATARLAFDGLPQQGLAAASHGLYTCQWRFIRYE